MHEIFKNTGGDFQNQLLVRNVIEDARNNPNTWDKKKSTQYTLQDVEARLANKTTKPGYDAFGRKLDKEGNSRYSAEDYLDKLTNEANFKIGRDGWLYNGLGWRISKPITEEPSNNIVDLEQYKEEKAKKNRWPVPRRVVAAALVAFALLTFRDTAPFAMAANLPPQPALRPAEVTINANSGLLFDARNNLNREYIEVTDAKADLIAERIINEWKTGVALAPGETLRIKIDKQLGAELGSKQRKEIADGLIEISDPVDQISGERFNLEELDNTLGLALPLENSDKPKIKDAILKKHW
jgi:hypothetical protein